MASLAVNGKPHTNGTVTNGDAHPTNGTRSRNPSSYAQKFDLPSHFIGGNHLDAAPAGTVKDFVASNDGHTVITNVSSPSANLEWPKKLMDCFHTGPHRQ